jgi:hypothetical protein
MSDAQVDDALEGGRTKLKEGSRESILSAIHDLQRAADQGSGEAHAQLAGLLAAGVSGPADWDRSVALLARAANLGWAPAHDELRVLARTSDALSADELHAGVDIRSLIAPKPAVTVRASPRIRVVGALFTPQECDWLIARARDRLTRASVYANAETASLVVDERTNREANFKPGDLDVATTFLRARLANSIRAPSHLFEPATVLHYAVGQHFARHYDFFDPDVPGHVEDLARRGQRIATALVYLNDGFEGGETDFPLLGWKFRGRPGDLLVFDNVDHTGAIDRRTLHAGCPPTAGEKWLLSQWVRDRPQS